MTPTRQLTKYWVVNIPNVHCDFSLYLLLLLLVGSLWKAARERMGDGKEKFKTTARFESVGQKRGQWC